jgi:tight adherence protein C
MMDTLSQIGIVGAAGAFLLFCAIILIVLGVTGSLSEREFFTRRLAFSGLAQAGDAQEAKARTILLEDGLLKRLAPYVTPTDEKELSTIRRRLLHAGYRRPSAVRVYYLAKAGLGFGMTALSALLVTLLLPFISLPFRALLILLPGLIGYVFPSFWVERRIEYRRQEAELAFPDFLDMLLICVEAGNSLDQACRRVARELKPVSDVLAEEVSVVNEELYAGKSRPAVFRDFAERLAVPDISAFAAVLRQSDEYGVSIAETLRVYASELRNKRLMRAEEKANMMPIKLALGSILFTIPPTMLIMAGPSVIMIVRAFAGIGGH